MAVAVCWAVQVRGKPYRRNINLPMTGSSKSRRSRIRLLRVPAGVFQASVQLESELLRFHPADTIILSDMWIVRHTYMDKAVKFPRLYGGYFYLSPAYLNYRTINMMINKNGMPAELRKKLK